MTPIASNYLRRAFNPDDTIAVALINKRTGEALQRIAQVTNIASERWQKWLRFKNREGFEVYYTINTLIPGARRRDKQDVQTIRHLFLDFDDGGAAAVGHLRQRSDVPAPNYIVSTSPGKFQVIWRASGFTLASAEQLLQGLARDTAADIAVTDAARLLRLPGFFNHKYEPAHFVTIEYFHTSSFSAQDFPIFPDTEFTPPNDATRNLYTAPAANPHSSGDGSRSGEDWRRTLSRLRLGADPDRLIRELADTRRDKAKPLDYATRTVRRALALIQSTPTRDRRAVE
jgi:hypothetical protein